MQFSIEKTEIQQKKVRSYRKKVRLPVVLLQETERSPAIRHLHQFEIWDDDVGKYSLFLDFQHPKRKMPPEYRSDILQNLLRP